MGIYTLRHYCFLAVPPLFPRSNVVSPQKPFRFGSVALPPPHFSAARHSSSRYQVPSSSLRSSCPPPYAVKKSCFRWIATPCVVEHTHKSKGCFPFFLISRLPHLSSFTLGFQPLFKDRCNLRQSFPPQTSNKGFLGLRNQAPVDIFKFFAVWSRSMHLSQRFFRTSGDCPSVELEIEVFFSHPRLSPFRS